MRVAYVTRDEVNQVLASGMARQCGAAVCSLDPEGPAADGLFDAIIYDLDAVPRHRRVEFLSEILSSRSTRARAVHGYDLTEEQADEMRRHGIAVAQHLEPGLLYALQEADRRNGSTATADEPQDGDTWIMLAG